MRIYTAPEMYIPEEGDVTCFLAGGITDCWEWQQKVIDELSQFSNIDNLVLFNPRRENFPIDDPNAAEEQIKWEFEYLNLCDIFSMYFCAGQSTQPICMYELGRHLARFQTQDQPQAVAITVEEGYVRAQDVEIQSNLALHDSAKDYYGDTITHADEIFHLYKSLRNLLY